jgi:hypothetical protein
MQTSVGLHVSFTSWKNETMALNRSILVTDASTTDDRRDPGNRSAASARRL